MYSNIGNTGNIIELDNDFTVTKLLPDPQDTGNAFGVQIPAPSLARKSDPICR